MLIGGDRIHVDIVLVSLLINIYYTVGFALSRLKTYLNDVFL